METVSFGIKIALIIFGLGGVVALAIVPLGVHRYRTLRQGQEISISSPHLSPIRAFSPREGRRECVDR